MAVADWLNMRMFNLVHRNNLVYNTCWEDPRLDRVALDLGPTDNVMVITSAGCNALDYALAEPNHVYAVDMNPRQNALLELKLAGIRHLEFEDFFQMFGAGRLSDAVDIYQQKAAGRADRLVARLLGPLDSLLRQSASSVLLPRYLGHVRHRS